MKAFCLFEQSGTFKNVFLKYGIQAEDFDIENQFNETDRQIDLFEEIRKGAENLPSIFDEISSEDLIFAFFPCTQFSTNSSLHYRITQWKHMAELKKIPFSFEYAFEGIIKRSKLRELFFQRFTQLFKIAYVRNLRMIIENPWSGDGFLRQVNPIQPPTYIDRNRWLHGDFFQKPTAYWMINFFPKKEMEFIKISERKKNINNGLGSGIERSLISPVYAENFVKNIILGV